jgi:hypothetical protein
MKKNLRFVAFLLFLAGMCGSLSAQPPQYYNYNTNGTNNSFPMNIAAGKDVQLLFLPGDFNQPSAAPAGNIVSIGMRIADTYPINGWTYTDFTIKLGQSAITTLTSGAFYTGTLTTVYYRASVAFTALGGTWLTFVLDTPFPYDPTQSLILEFGQCGVPGATGYSACYTNITNIRRVWSVGGCPFAPYAGGGASIYHMGINLGVAGPTVVTTAATSITGNSATLNGTVNANGASTAVTFEYGLTTAYGTTVPGVPSPVTGSSVTPVSAAISGLSPNTLYHFRVKGTNTNGTSNGSDLTFTTGAAPPTVVTTAATAVGATTATVNGTVNANGSSTTVTFQYGLTTAYGSTVSGTPSPVTGTTVTSVSGALSGLLPNTLYHFRVVGVSAAGTSYGSDLTFSTIPPPTVVTNPATNVASTSATLNGSVNANGGSTTVTFDYGLTTAYGSSIAATPSPVTGNTPTSVSANLTGLTNGATYHYRCVGVNAAGTTYGNDVLFSTGCSAPIAPGSITGNTTVCGGSTGNVYSVSQVPFATSYNWFVPAGATITAGQGTLSITVTMGSNNGSVYVQAANGCGGGPFSFLNITVNPQPTPTVSGPATACQGLIQTYTTQSGMSAYTWTVSAGGSIQSGAGTNSITVKWNSAGAQNVSVNYSNANGCRAASPTVYNVTVNAASTPTITGTNSLCVYSGYYTYFTEPGYTGYNWTVSSGGQITAGQSTNSIQVLWIGAGPQTVGVNYTNSLGCGAVTPTQYPVTVNSQPAGAGAITGPSTVCAGAQGVSYSTSSVAGATAYAWSLPQGFNIVSGAGTNSITVNIDPSAASGSILVAGTNLCGAGSPTSLPVTVTSLPAAAGAITGSAQVCANSQNVAYSVPAITGASGYNWTLPTGATIASGANTNSITVNFAGTGGSITVFGTNSCGSGTASPAYAVTVNPKPPTPAVTVNGYVLTSSAASGNQWYHDGTAIQGATSATYTVPATEPGYYWVKVTLLGCTSDESNHVYIAGVGIGESAAGSFTVKPVPNDGQFKAIMNCKTATNVTITVYNALGAPVFEKKDITVHNETEVAINIRPAPSGVYTVVFTSADNKTIRKIIVDK